ncbi:MAG: cytochrome c biogenesis protein CcdA [Candidatus Thermoplasmatota archaeon]|nr:cytochrome c biogenesis protein CcdA [Candidatus Thermoplasmatota archaeon]
MPVDLAGSLAAFAFLAGLGTFANPCNLGLLPAYLGYYAGTEGAGEQASTMRSLWAGTRFGAAASLGVLTLFTGVAGILVLARRHLGLNSQTLGAAAVDLGIVMGVLLLLLGGLMLASLAPSLTLPVRAPEERTLPSMFLFGLFFALAGIGCTLPIFLGVVGSQLLARDAVGVVTSLLSFGAGIALPLLGLSLLASVAREQASRRVQQVLPWAKPAGGILLIIAGLVVLWYYLIYLPGTPV